MVFWNHLRMIGEPAAMDTLNQYCERFGNQLRVILEQVSSDSGTNFKSYSMDHLFIISLHKLT